MNYYKVYYLKYKKYLVLLILNFATLFILFAVIIPQLLEVNKLNKNISDKKKENIDLKDSLEALVPLSEEGLKSDLALSEKALPSAKDVSLMFLTVTSAASSANVDLAGFSLKLGGVYGGSLSNFSKSGFPTLTMNVIVKSKSPLGIVNFISRLHEMLPLSEVDKIDVTSDVANFNVNFYYKPYDLTAISTQKVAPMSENEKKLIEQLRSWDK